MNIACAKRMTHFKCQTCKQMCCRQILAAHRCGSSQRKGACACKLHASKSKKQVPRSNCNFSGWILDTHKQIAIHSSLCINQHPTFAWKGLRHTPHP